MKKVIVALFLLLFTYSYSSPPVVSNVRAGQKEDDVYVDIYYNVQDKDNDKVFISFMASSNNGVTWNVEVKNIEGDAGLVETGDDKHAIWKVSKDYPTQFSTSFRIKVLARDKICPKIGDAGMIFIPQAEYKLGKDRKVKPLEYCIDKYEFPNRKGEYPLVFVDYKTASDSCAKKGKRLCTENEWEIACRGAHNLKFPYGNNYSKYKCNTSSDSLRKIGKNRACMSDFGVYDLSGNAFEWVKDWYHKSTEADPKEKPVMNYRSMRGGNWYLGELYSKCGARQYESPNRSTGHVGFRCCSGFLE